MAKRTFSGETRPRSSPPNDVGSLLEQDWFLREVLSRLIDDNFHECRRVCRKWNAVWKTLPVKLRHVRRQHLSKVLATFPNVVEVSCTPRFPSRHLGLARQLAGMSSLRHLDRLGYFSDGTRTEVQRIHMETYNRLQSLGVYLNTASCEDFRNALPHLTGLRELDVDVTWYQDIDPTSWDPFTELSGLRELTLSGRLLKNASHQNLFPSTALTRLTVNAGVPTDVAAPELLAVRCRLNHFCHCSSLLCLFRLLAVTLVLSDPCICVMFVGDPWSLQECGQLCSTLVTSKCSKCGLTRLRQTCISIRSS